MIDGLVVKPLKVFEDERGKLLRMLRCDDELFAGFGEIYFSVTNPGVVKGWKKHLRMTQHFAVPSGLIKIVFYDDRPASPSKGLVQELVLGGDNYQLVRVPPQVWYAFSCVSGQAAMIANCTDMPHDPLEVVLLPLMDESIPYAWNNGGES
ncbi:MAG: dTDP-4-dehydrorhamnose 3,5-epimerase family protein [Candidatus Omnitrophota bacterium]